MTIRLGMCWLWYVYRADEGDSTSPFLQQLPRLRWACRCYRRSLVTALDALPQNMKDVPFLEVRVSVCFHPPLRRLMRLTSASIIMSAGPAGAAVPDGVGRAAGQVARRRPGGTVSHSRTVTYGSQLGSPCLSSVCWRCSYSPQLLPETHGDVVDTRLDVDAALLLVWVMHGQVVCWCRDWPSSKEVDLELMGEREGYPDKHRSVTGRRARPLGQGGGRAGHPGRCLVGMWLSRSRAWS